MPSLLLWGLLTMLTGPEEQALVQRCIISYQVCAQVDCDDKHNNAKYVLCRRDCEQRYLACMAEVETMRERT